MVLALAAKRRWSPWGWAQGWAVLFALAAWNRLWIACLPEYAPLLGQILVIASGIATLVYGGPSLMRDALHPRPRSWPFAIVALVLLARGFFPNFDVDTLSYHLSSLIWLKLHPGLSAISQSIGATDLRYRWIGFEDFLAVPGLNGNLLLYAGLTGAVLKLMTVASVTSLIPSRFFAVRYAMVFLILIDDHFLFSGQNRFAYINPSFVGLVPLMLWMGWRAWRGHPSAPHYAAALAFGVGAEKYHGLFFQAAVIVLLVAAALKHRRWPRVRASTAALITAGASVWLAVYGVNFLETGSPVYPLALGPLVPAFSYYGSIFDYSVQDPLWKLILQFHLRLLIFPGNMALKMVAVLLVPTLALVGLRPRIKALRRMPHPSSLYFALGCLLTCVAWVLISNKISHVEARFIGRYPRYVYGAGVAGIGFLTLALFRAVPRVLRDSWLPGAAGIAALVFLVANMDRRAYNLSPDLRPAWRDIGNYFLHPSAPLATSLEQPWARLFEKITLDNAPAILTCIDRLGKTAEERMLLRKGDGLVLFNEGYNWPAALIFPAAVRLDTHVAVSIPDSMVPWPSLAVVAKSWIQSPPEFRYPHELRKAVFARLDLKSPVCETPQFLFLKVKPPGAHL